MKGGVIAREWMEGRYLYVSPEGSVRSQQVAPSSSIRRVLDADEKRLLEEVLAPAQASCSGRSLHRRSVSDI